MVKPNIRTAPRHRLRSKLSHVASFRTLMGVLALISLLFILLNQELLELIFLGDSVSVFLSLDEQLAIDTSESPPFAIFYNVFIPDGWFDARNALAIVREQIGQVGASYATKHTRPVVLFLTTIGSTKLDQRKLSRYCGAYENLTCRHIQHHKAGSESLTLQRVTEFCQRQPSFRVSYIHSKGSFHKSSGNDNWRRVLTEAALHKDCMNPPKDECNLCGVQFFPQFSTIIPGNMWTAQCSYINKLLPPQEYQEKHEEAIRQTFLLKLRNQITTHSLTDRKDYFGLDRYNSEHWVGSHPDLQPCELEPTGNVGALLQKTHSTKDMAWSMAPRNNGIAQDKKGLYDFVRKNEDVRIREYYLLPGHILKWMHCYSLTPPEGSWAWSWFPDGNMWRDNIKKYGGDAVNQATKKFYFSLDGSNATSAFAPEKRLQLAESTVPEESARQHIAFFYRAVTGDSPRAENLDLIRSQLDIVADSHSERGKPARIFLDTVGSEEGMESVLELCSQNEKVRCIHVRHLAHDYEGETLRLVYDFCQHQESFQVVYIHNQGPIQIRNDGTNANLLLHMTSAATSKVCLEQMPDTCNVCGLLFSVLWTFFLPGNMFSASCSYVRKLLPPQVFEERMKDVVAAVLMARIRLTLTTSLYEDRMDYYGLDRYAIDHWVGSHPSIKPCHLSGDTENFDYWRKAIPGVSFSKATTPRRLESPLAFNQTMVEKVLQDENMRRRENCFLAGLLLRWYALYGQAPPSSSWIWSLFPDGALWREGVEKHGSKVVDELTAEFVHFST